MKLHAGQAVISAIKQSIASDIPLLLEGERGVGKSVLVEQAASELNLKFIALDLSMLEPPDLVGLPTTKSGFTEYAPPSFLPKDGAGILFFDEINRAPSFMLSPLMRLLTSKTLNQYRLPDSWRIVAAMNPNDGNYQVTEMCPALLSRFIRIEVEADVQNFLAWAGDNGVHPAVMRHLAQVPDIFESSNPRSWTYMSRLLHEHDAAKGSEELLLVMCSGLVGDTHAVAFVESYLNGEKPLTAKDVIDNYPQHQKTVKGWRTEKQTDLLAATAHNVKIALQASSVSIGDIGAFLKDLPGDIAKDIRTFAKECQAA